MYFKVDDCFAEHPKVLKLGRGMFTAIGVWTLCGTWVSRYETDGFIPRAAVRRLGCDSRAVKRLVECEFWTEEEREGVRGYRFVDWDQWQPSRARMDEIRRSRREAGQRGGRRSGESRRSKAEANASRLLEANRTQTRPDQSIPPSGGERAGARARCPRHAELPVDDPGPACRDCKAAREVDEERVALAVSERLRREREERIAAQLAARDTPRPDASNGRATARALLAERTIR